jgi:hypothetical protein
MADKLKPNIVEPPVKAFCSTRFIAPAAFLIAHELLHEILLLCEVGAKRDNILSMKAMRIWSIRPFNENLASIDIERDEAKVTTRIDLPGFSVSNDGVYVVSSGVVQIPLFLLVDDCMGEHSAHSQPACLSAGSYKQ